ncbi:hypothetical protein ACFX2I_021161 [Malus domestica]
MDLLKALTETRLSPTNFKILDYFPPGTKVQDLDDKAYNIAVKWVRESNGGKFLDNSLPHLPRKWLGLPSTLTREAQGTQDQRRLKDLSPATSHESLSLELSGAWEPSESSGFAGSYPATKSHLVSHLDLSKSDHIPLFLQLLSARPPRQRLKMTFRFKEFWANYDEYESVIQKAWSNLVVGVPMFHVVQKIKATWNAFLKWSQPFSGVARRKWASNRKAKNKIKGLSNEVGVWVSDDRGIESMVLGYFNNLFSSAGVSNCDQILNTMEPRAIGEMNLALDRVFHFDEVRNAIFQMKPSTALSPYGITPFFFQRFWHIIGADDPKDMPQLRPISLCNVLFKIASKVLTNRFKVIMPAIISPTQSAFVPGRNITDNVILASELSNLISKRWRGSNSLLSLKLDISKAYDRIK